MKDLKLIATLPNINFKKEIIRILESDEVDEARYNTGSTSLLSSIETLNILKELENKYKKRIWIDLKGRQLRIIKWADPLYDVIELNHPIDIEYPAKAIFRGGSESEVVRTRGNKIAVWPLPKEALGAGQSINVIAKSMDIKGYLVQKDIEYLKLCKEIGINNIMASYVERKEDLDEIKSYLPDANIVSKIESLKGIKFILENEGLQLMAARDDLYIESGRNSSIIPLLKTIIDRDKNAICASRIFSSLKKNSYPELSDYSDLELMTNMGYKNFMLDDTISQYHFDSAVKAWKEYKKCPR